ncbi:MAG: hypothetical protein V2B14_00820 [bacterium]
MKKQEKEELLKQKLLNLKNNLEIAEYCIKSALENLNNLDDFNSIINNWNKYKNFFKIQDKNL